MTASENDVESDGECKSLTDVQLLHMSSARSCAYHNARASLKMSSLHSELGRIRITGLGALYALAKDNNFQQPKICANCHCFWL